MKKTVELIKGLIFGENNNKIQDVLTSSEVIAAVKEAEKKLFSIIPCPAQSLIDAANELMTQEEINLLAIYSILNTPFQPELSDYEEVLYGQRSLLDGTHAGSYYELTKREIKRAAVNANYQFAEIIPNGKIVFKTNDMIGFYGMIALDEIAGKNVQLYGHNLKYRPDDTFKAKTEICVVAADLGVQLYQKTDETHVVSLIHSTSGERFMVTLFPGALVNPSVTPWEELKHAEPISFEKAITFGFTHAKLVDKAPSEDELEFLSKIK